MIPIGYGREERDRLQEQWPGVVFMNDRVGAHLTLEAPSGEGTTGHVQAMSLKGQEVCNSRGPI